MKPRARWLTRFASWFFNTSPEWVASEKGESPAAEPPAMQQMEQAQPASTSSEAPAGKVADPNRPPR